MKDDNVPHNFTLDERFIGSVTYNRDKTTDHIGCIAIIYDKEVGITFRGDDTGLTKQEALADALNIIQDQLELYLDKVDKLYDDALEDLDDQKTEALDPEGLK